MILGWFHNGFPDEGLTQVPCDWPHCDAECFLAVAHVARELGIYRCSHPDPKTLPWVFCRSCGYWVEGVRMGLATDDVLRERLTEAVGAPVTVGVSRS